MTRGSRDRRVPTRTAIWLTALALVVPIALAGCGLAERAGSVTNDQGTTGAVPLTAAPRVTEQKSVGSADAAGEAAIAPAPGGSGVDASTVPASDKLIVRNKTLRLEVKDVEGTIAKIRDLAKRDGADITDLQVATSTDEPIYRPMEEGAAPAGSSVALRAFVTVRVPAKTYEAFIEAAAKLGDVKFQIENSRDVTQQHIDLSARLANLRAEEAQLREFFTKAKTVAEMIQVEQELARVRGEIESMAAQVAYLERQAAMATVTLELTEPKPLVRPTGIDWGTGAAFTNSVRAFVGTVNVLIVVLGPVLALGLFVVLPAVLIARFAWKRYRRRTAAAQATVEPDEDTKGA